MTVYKSNEVKEKVWEQLKLRRAIPVPSRRALDLEEETDEAIEQAVLITAQAIFKEIRNLRNQPVNAGTIPTTGVLELEDQWLHDACEVCERRLPSVIQRKDGTRICVRCEASHA